MIYVGLHDCGVHEDCIFQLLVVVTTMVLVADRNSGFKNHDPVGYYLLTWNVWQRPVGDGAVEGLRNQEDGQHFRSVG